MPQNGAMADSLAGKLLIASPGLQDFFRRSVVLMVEHTTDGAFGLVLNRVSETPVGEAVPVLAGLAGEEELVRIGGPVAPESVVAIGEFEDPSLSAKPLVGQVGLVDLDVEGAEIGRVRVYAGHAGWGPAQLDEEVEREAWIVTEATPELPFSDGDIWGAALARRGGEYALLAHLSKGSVAAKPGQAVKRGDRLGLCGNSGNTSEPHLN